MAKKQPTLGDVRAALVRLNDRQEGKGLPRYETLDWAAEVLDELAAPPTATLGAVQATADVLVEINAERRRQDERWGENRQLPDTLWLSIITEEVGEVARAINDSQDPPAFETSQTPVSYTHLTLPTTPYV